MTRSELVDLLYVSGSTGLSREQIDRVVGLTLKYIGKALVEGEKVQLLGFGTFSVKTRVAREGTNPRTGETINLPESKRVHFSTSKLLKDALNK